MATSKDNTELEALLQGGVHLTVTPANPALGVSAQQAEIAHPLKTATKINPSSLSPNPKPVTCLARWTRPVSPAGTACPGGFHLSQ